MKLLPHLVTVDEISKLINRGWSRWPWWL